MARLTIELIRRPGSAATYHVSLVSDEDATPREHELNHRRAIAQLLPGVELDTESKRFQVEREQQPLQSMPLAGGDDDGYEVIDLG
jgi:hypothetical protein